MYYFTFLYIKLKWIGGKLSNKIKILCEHNIEKLVNGLQYHMIFDTN
jgi:hypothetical protein